MLSKDDLVHRVKESLSLPESTSMERLYSDASQNFFRQHTIDYYRFLHRGLHEDVMVIGRGTERFVADINKFLMDKKAKFQDLGVESYSLYRLIDSHLVVDNGSQNNDSHLSMFGEFDTWIKAYPDGEVRGDISFYLSSESLAMSRALSRQLFQLDPALVPEKVNITLRQLGKNKKTGFIVNRIIDLGGKYNVIFLPLSSLPKLSFPFRYTFPDHFGINVSRLESPQMLKERLQKEFPEYQVVTSDELEYMDTSSVNIYLKFAPNFLFFLFIANLLIMYIFIVLDNFRLRKKELKLMDLYLYSKVKKSTLFSFLNTVPVAAGFMFAVPFSFYVLKNLSLQSLMYGMGASVVDTQLFPTSSLIVAVVELLLIIICALVGSFVYAWRKVAID